MPGSVTSSWPIATEWAVSGIAGDRGRDRAGIAPVAPGSPAPGPIGRHRAAALPPASPGPITSTRTGLATSRSQVAHRPAGATSSGPIANVAAATPTTSAPSVIDARTGMGETGRRPRAGRAGRSAGASPSRRRRPPSGRGRRGAAAGHRRDRADPAGADRGHDRREQARRQGDARARPTTTGSERLNAVGSPNDSGGVVDHRLAGDRPDDDADDRPDDGRHEHLARRGSRLTWPRRVPDGLHDPDVPVARQDDPGHDVGDEERRGQQREDREREQDRDVEVGEPVDAGLQVEVGLCCRRRRRPAAPAVIAAVAAVRSAAVADGRHPVEHLLVGRPAGTSAARSVGLIQAPTSGVLTEPAIPTTVSSRPGPPIGPTGCRPFADGDGWTVTVSPTRLPSRRAVDSVEDGLAGRLPPAARLRW